MRNRSIYSVSEWLPSDLAHLLAGGDGAGRVQAIKPVSPIPARADAHAPRNAIFRNEERRVIFPTAAHTPIRVANFSRHRRLAATLALATSLVGCAPMVWIKQGGTQDEFAQDKYACLQESQQRQGRAQANRFGAAAIDTVETNSGLYGACMNARGWYLGQQEAPASGSVLAGSVSSSSSKWSQPGWTPPNGIGVASAEEALRKAEADRRRAAEKTEQQLTAARSRLSLICYDKTAYGALFERGACKPEAITAAQLADRSKPTTVEIGTMRRYINEMNVNAAIVAAADRAAGNQFGAQAVEAARDAVVAPAAGLIDGSITWGAYNKARADALKGATAAK